MKIPLWFALLCVGIAVFMTGIGAPSIMESVGVNARCSP